MGRNEREPSVAERADLAIVRGLGDRLEGPVAKSFGTAGKIGDEPPVRVLAAGLLAIGLWCDDRRMMRAAIRIAAAHTLAMALKKAGKDRIDRTRPAELLDTGRYAMRRGRSRAKRLRSFPSGHTAGPVAAARAAAREYPGGAPLFYLAAGLIGAAQVARRAHFPGDVLAGAAAGVAAEWAADRVLRHGAALLRG